MATWISHLRIADRLLEYGFQLEREPFLLGNLVPDVSSISETISHFHDDYNNRLQPEDFYDAYLHNQSHDANTYAFLIGYYAHLLADVEWIGTVWRPFQHHYPELATRIESDSDFTFQFNRLEFFGHDFLYLHDNSEYDSWRIIQNVTSIPDCLEFVSGDALLEWLQNEVISTYQDKETLQKAQTHDFQYMSRHGLQTWLDCTIGTVIEMLKGKQVPCPNPHPLWGAYIQPYA